MGILAALFLPRADRRWSVLYLALLPYLAIPFLASPFSRYRLPATPLMLIRLFDGYWISKDWESYDRISPNLARAVIASEDSGFCEHWGFDFAAIEKALRHNEKSRRLRGGSRQCRYQDKDHRPAQHRPNAPRHTRSFL